MRTTLVALIVASALPVSAAELSFVGAFDWGVDAANGVSGLEVSDDGLTFAAVSDRGWYLAGTVTRTDGRITGVDVTQVTPLLGHDGFPVTARRLGDWSDSEGLAILPDGTHYISFERWAHVSRYTDPTETPTLTRDHASFYDYRENRQLEAIAVDPDGQVFTLPERPLPGGDGFPVYRLSGDQWEVMGEIVQLDRFSPVGADFGSDGTLYLLERKLVLGLWWQSRVRRFDTPEGAGEILWTSRRGEHDNLEGLSVWDDDLGLRITMVSDNNMDEDEPTRFVEYRLTE